MHRRTPRILPVIAIALVVTAHVGSSNAYFEGPAGPYDVRVIVRTPGIVPGLAQISVRITGGEGVRHVTVRPLRWDAGLEGAPPADTAIAVAGEPNLYSAELWLMTRGSYSVHVTVDGDDGTGTVFVPVLALAERRLAMGVPMGIALLAAALFLFVGALTIFGAAVREAVLPPGDHPDTKRTSRGRVAMVGGGAVLALALLGGRNWWNAVDGAYRRSIYRPLEVATAVTPGPARVMTLTIEDETWLGRQWTPLMPDHGKLMHMFIVRDGDLDAFAHIHPVSFDTSSFHVILPASLPSGDYRVYADIVHESGFAQTLTDTVAVPELQLNIEAPQSTGVVQFTGVEAWLSTADGRQRLLSDADDSWTVTPSRGEATEAAYALASGHTITWDRTGQGLVVDREMSLRFVVNDAEGAPATLRPYMGMMSHAAVSRDDGSVFVHLHPAGSINVAAQMRFEREEGSDTDSVMTGMRQPEDSTNVVTFPFVFERPGDYRVWVQVKTESGVETGVWDVEVEEPGGESGEQ